MYKRIQANVFLALAILLSSTPSIVNAQVRSSVKPIPKAFIGEWVGIIRDKQRPTKKVIKDLCNSSYYQDDAYVMEFNADRQSSNTTLSLEDNFYEYPVSYTKYTPNHITGKQLSVVFELGNNDELVGKDVERFDYRITKGELTVTNKYGTYYLTRCK